ncbi:hypothetical protein F5141DRAFT_1067334 [Pisolithus sp. B1]|nr:hypothetical protein F5141DRAFT_1067334 [Pisolithus sp. B1]
MHLSLNVECLNVKVLPMELCHHFAITLNCISVVLQGGMFGAFIHQGLRVWCPSSARMGLGPTIWILNHLQAKDTNIVRYASQVVMGVPTCPKRDVWDVPSALGLLGCHGTSHLPSKRLIGWLIINSKVVMGCLPTIPEHHCADT